jgi:hypothetical protein
MFRMYNSSIYVFHGGYIQNGGLDIVKHIKVMNGLNVLN